MKYSKCLVEIFYCLYFILKPFYMKASGTFQVSDICLMIACYFYLSGGKWKDFRIMHIFYLFFISAATVNIVYGLKMQSSQFFTSTVYWIFNLAFLLLSYDLLCNRHMTAKLIVIFKVTIYSQFLFYLLDVGRWYGIGRYRYKGTFNDPNQFAFYMLICGLSIFLYGMYRKSFSIQEMFCLLLDLFLIVKSSSRGMTLCVALVIVFEMLIVLYHFFLKIEKRIRKNKFSVVLVLLPVFVAVCFFAIYGRKAEMQSKEGYSVWDRWMQTISSVKAGKGLTSGGINAFEERGIDRVWKYPQYCLLGAGEGKYDRFDTFMKGEIHSTFLGILFCYGCFPTIMLVLWCFLNIRNLSGKYLAVYAALIIESFTLVHYRQPVFWLLFILGYCIQNKLWEKEGYADIVSHYSCL